MAGTSETYTQKWPGKGGGSWDGFHLAINKHASHLGTRGASYQIPLTHFPGGRHSENWNGNAWGLELALLKESCSQKGRGEQEENEVSGSFASRKGIKVWRDRKCHGK